MSKDQQSVDRGTRQAAAEARYGFFAEHSEEFDHYYDELVRLRTTIAHKLGFPTFTPLGYLRCHRSDYQPDMVDSFRKEVEHHIVPLASMLREEQRARLGLDQLFYYDENLFYPQGNPLPTGTPEEMIQAARRMYAQLSEESGTFFDEMDQRKLMDLLSRAGKAPGGYCDYLASFRAPFIFANFNGTSGDVDVLTHEAGHAFQVWLCQEKQIPEYQFATMDAAEIPSMAMEFFTWPWMEQFFAEQASRYRYEHLVSSLTFLPYGCLVDHFQHQVYAEPTLTPQKRRHIWRHLEERYLPHRNYNGQPFLEDGGFWFQQGHIYEVPFYYIDYVLAQSCVFQLWQRAGIDRESAWQDYLTLCRAGGSQSFTNLLPLAKVASPFAQGTMAAVAESVTTWLNNPDNQPK
ncbi:MAG: M3 family oligoendopeptidase [Firmicutes bacterium]|nr:M3 family oligoendopeptidase [Bacillota bacterium]